MGSDIAHFYGKLVFTLRVLKGGGFFKQKNGTYEWPVHFQNFLALQMNLKTITTIVILTIWNSRRKI